MNTFKQIISYISLLAASAIFLSACAQPYTPPDYSAYYWPKEPDRKRLQLLTMIRHDLDIRPMTQSESLFGGQTYFRFKKPHSVVADNDGNIYVTDSYLGTVFVLNIEKQSIRRFIKPGGWKQPIGLGIDNVNSLLAVTDSNSVIVTNYRTGQTVLSLGQKEGFITPHGLAMDPKNRYLYIGDTKASRIYKYDYSGNRLATIAVKGSGPTGVYYPGQIAVDKQGRLFVVDTMNWKIKIYGTDGKFIREFGEHGSVIGQFNRPKGISVSKDGIIAVTDNDLGIFMLMSDTGQVYTFMGGVGSSPARFAVPMGIYIDDSDKIYVVDQVNRRLQIFQMYTDKYYATPPPAAPAAPQPAAGGQAQ